MTDTTMTAQMSLGDLIDALEALPDQSQSVEFDFCGVAPTTINSSRGWYAQPALGWAPTGYSGEAQSPTVSDLVRELELALTKTYEGWKGGDYRYSRSSPLWVDNPGDWSETFVTGVDDSRYAVILKTHLRGE